MLRELRIYHCVPGRLPDLNKRFETITLKLWEKHGIRQVGFWTALIGESNNALYYMLEWESLAERERIWNAFATDPQWLAARAETEKNGPIVQYLSNSILTPTSYSAAK
jgi:NIPSNAP